MKIVNDYHFKTFIDNAKKNNIPFRMEQTGSMKRLILSDGRKFSTKPKMKLNGYELNLIQKVKLNAQKLDLKQFPNVTNTDVPYIKNAVRIKTNVRYTSELYELDLSSAYWNFAFQNKIIDSVTYHYASNPKVSKGARLIALGNLAKKPLVTEFDGNRFKMYQSPDLETAKLFYLCALFTGEQMIDLERIIDSTPKGKFMFFWVDAIFFQGYNAMLSICADLNSKNIGYKLYRLDKITLKKDKIIVHSSEHKKAEREFLLEKSKNKFTIND
jgi:hypothetical protein